MSPHPKAPHYEGFEDEANPGEFRFRIVGANGEPMAASEGYAEKWEVERAVERLDPDAVVVWVS